MFTKILPLLITIALFFSLWIIGHNLSSKDLEQIVSGAGYYAPGVFILFTLLSFIISPISGVPFLYAGYFIFGRKAIFYTEFAAFCSVITNYWIARLLGRQFVDRIVGTDMRKKIDRYLAEYGHVSLYLVRVTLANFHDYISYAAGLMQMHFGHYVLISTIALLQETLIWYLLSETVNSAEAFTLWTMTIGLVTSACFFTGSYMKQKIKKRHHSFHTIGIRD